MGKPQIVILENKASVGTLSVGDAPNTSNYSKQIEVCVAREGIEMSARFFISRHSNPKVFEALKDLEMAMLEEGAELMDIITTG